MLKPKLTEWGTFFTNFSANNNAYCWHVCSVTEKQRSIDHSKGAHGSPGIYFKYDFAALKIEAEEKRKPWLPFIVRLVGIVGGAFSLSSFFFFAFDYVTCKGRTTEVSWSQYKISSTSWCNCFISSSHYLLFLRYFRYSSVVNVSFAFLHPAYSYWQSKTTPIEYATVIIENNILYTR